MAPDLGPGSHLELDLGVNAVETTDRHPCRPVGRRQYLAMLAILATMSGVGAYLVSTALFPLYSVNHDEPMYVFAAEMLESGHLTVPADAQTPFVAPWATGVHGEQLVMKYTPVWPAAIAAGSGATGSQRGALVVVAALLPLLGAATAQQLTNSRRSGMSAAILLAVSPVVIIQSGTYLPYLFQLDLGLAFIALLIAGRRRHAAIPLVGAGFLLGLAAFARPFDAVLVSVPMLIAAALFDRTGIRALWCDARWGILGLVPPVLVSLAYNNAVMGTPLEHPFGITGPNDTFGFGQRGVTAQSTFEFTWFDSLQGTASTLIETGAWVAGGPVLIVLAVFGFHQGRSLGALRWGLVGIGVVTTVGYLAFWAPFSITALWPGARLLGPYYHLALIIPLVILASVGLTEISHRSALSGRLLLGGILVTSAAVTAGRIQANEHLTRDQVSDHAVVTAADPQGLLFIDGRGPEAFNGPFPYLENQPGFDNDPLFLADRGPENFELLDSHSQRPAQVMFHELRPGDPLFEPTLVIAPIEHQSASEIRLRFRFENATAEQNITAYATTYGLTRRLVLDTQSQLGSEYDFEWVLALEGSDFEPLLPADPWWRLELPDDEVLTTLAIGVGVGPSANLDDQTLYERRINVRVRPGTGEVELLWSGEEWSRWMFGEPTWIRQDLDPGFALVSR